MSSQDLTRSSACARWRLVDHTNERSLSQTHFVLHLANILLKLHLAIQNSIITALGVHSFRRVHDSSNFTSKDARYPIILPIGLAFLVFILKREKALAGDVTEPFHGGDATRKCCASSIRRNGTLRSQAMKMRIVH